MTIERREDVIASLIAEVNKLYARMREKKTRASRVTIVPASKPKLGRNDPCRRGLGKTFKRCCGAVSVH